MAGSEKINQRTDSRTSDKLKPENTVNLVRTLSHKDNKLRGKEIIISGTSEVIAPTEKISRPRILLPEIELRRKGCA